MILSLASQLAATGSMGRPITRTGLINHTKIDFNPTGVQDDKTMSEEFYLSVSRKSSRPTTLVADETVHEERGDSMERAATTAASLDAEQDSDEWLRKTRCVRSIQAGKKRFETTSPEGYDRLLWGDLITLFEPSEEDEIRKAQQDYTLISMEILI
ncbi:hypothetical protein Tco_1540592 [Tanacetum coccineum]